MRIGPKKDCWKQQVGQLLNPKSEIAREFFFSLADTTCTMPDSQGLDQVGNSQRQEHQELLDTQIILSLGQLSIVSLFLVQSYMASLILFSLF